MAKITINSVSWTAAPTVAQVCTVSYRLTSSSDIPGNYTLVSNSVTINPDGSLATPLAITGLANETSYTVKAVNNCGGTGTLQAYTTPIPTCPSGYTLSDDHTYCFRTDSQPANQVNPGSPYVICKNPYTDYSTFGTKILKPNGYNVTGEPKAGSSFNPTTITTGTFFYNSGGTVNGPLNRSGIWPCDGSGNPCGGTCPPYSTQVGFSRQINIPATKQYYIGIAGDNRLQITIQDAVSGTRTIVDQDPSIMSAYYGTSGTGDVTFKAWHIYPVLLNAGPNIITLTGVNNGSQGVMGAEIYDNTEAQLVAATATGNLNYVFSTDPNLGFVNLGDSFQNGNYDCSPYPGYSLVYEGGVYLCKKYDTTPVIS